MYPPEKYLVTDKDKIYSVIENFSLATLISNAENDVFVTQLPLILNRHNGRKDTLIGHMDRNNPHCKHLDANKVTALFHGPDAYISPSVYESPQLPTWNFVSVYLKGTAHVMDSTEALKKSMIDMTTRLEPEHDPYDLEADSEKMEALLPYVVGFEIEIEDMVGRFKLSQDKSEKDTQLAKEHLIEENTNSEKLSKLLNRLIQ